MVHFYGRGRMKSSLVSLSAFRITNLLPVLFWRWPICFLTITVVFWGIIDLNICFVALLCSYKRTLFCCTLLYCASWCCPFFLSFFFFFKLIEGFGSLVSSNSWHHFFQKHLFISCLCHIMVIFGIFWAFLLLLYFLVSTVTDLWCCYWNYKRVTNHAC